MSQLQLKDGSFREFTPGQSAAEIVKGIGMGLYRLLAASRLTAKSVTCVPLLPKTAPLKSAPSMTQMARKPSGTRLLMSSLRRLSGCIQTQSLRLARQSTAVSTMISM